MILTINQMKGLKTAVARYKAGEKYTVISGYAGTGKSTLVRFIIDALNITEDKICYCAFTGKAAEVLRKKGNKNVCTLHKLLYKSIPKPSGGFIRTPKPSIVYKVVVVDEISMAPKTLIDLLFTHDVYVICLGDPGQLPPIEKDKDNHLLDCPHIFLDEIMRQAQESEIIRLTMAIRENKPINYFKGNEVQIIPKKELTTGILKWGDQILVATNLTKNNINTKMRKLFEKDGAPTDGDKIICLRNYWDDLSQNESPLINGTIGIVKNSFLTKRYLPYFIAKQFKKTYFNVFIGDLVIPEIQDFYSSVEMDYDMIITKNKCCDWKLSYALGRLKQKYGEIVPKEFDFAYAITIWKAQGSEWNNVVVLEENFPYDKETHTRAMYTAATRASQKLVWVR